MPHTILVVDDQAGARKVLAAELEDAGFAVLMASNGAEAWERFCATAPDLVITDMVMPRSDGIELLIRIRSRSEVPVILFSAHGSVETAVTALKAGADDFVCSTNVDVETLVGLVTKALARRDALYAPSDLEHRLVGSTPVLSKVRQRIAGLAPLRTPVLITGEPGTGRDTVARALHDLGSTAGKGFHRIAAESFAPSDPIPPTGAVYVDHVHRLSPGAQSIWWEHLRRAEAQAHERTPRVLASSSESLVARASEGDFHAQLAEVLQRFEIVLPPLRERAEDIPALANSIIERAALTLGRGRVRLSGAAANYLARQRWPRNVAQLAQVLERSIAFCRGREIPCRTIEEVLADCEENLASIRALREAREREQLVRAIRATGGNVTQTAQLLGRSRSAIYRLIAKHGVRLNRPG